MMIIVCLWAKMLINPDIDLLNHNKSAESCLRSALIRFASQRRAQTPCPVMCLCLCPEECCKSHKQANFSLNTPTDKGPFDSPLFPPSDPTLPPSLQLVRSPPALKVYG